MTDREAVITSFDFINIKPTEDVINKSLEICHRYNLTAEDFVDQWSAYTISHLGGKPPTVDSLVALERKEYAKSNTSLSSKKVSTPKNVKVYRKSENVDTEEVVSSYTNVTPKANKNVKRVRSPETGSEPKRFHTTSSSQPTFSPASYSPTVGSQSVNYSERTNCGQVVLSFGADHLQKKATYKGTGNFSVAVAMYNTSDNYLTGDTIYMYEVLRKKMFSMNAAMNQLGALIMKKYKLGFPEPFTKLSSKIMTYGRINCDSDGRLNVASVILEGTRELTMGKCVPLSLKKLQTYSLFPGQVVSVCGTNINGTTFVAEEIFADASPELPTNITQVEETLQIVVASGPFTLIDNITYEPLQDLLKYVIVHKPQVLMLIGPFLDVNHENIADGTMAEPFGDFFESLVESIMVPLKDTNTQVVMVSSSKDAHHHAVYPTPPYTTKEKYQNLNFVPDPSLVNIDGLVIGVTSADILFHLAKEEICGSQSGDRMGRFAGHILSQRSFYPLYPPDKEMFVDHDLLETFGKMDVMPHILIVPSSFRYFVKNINGCVVINPEKISKGFIGGTFARIEVQPKTQGSITNHIACQIVNI